MAEHCCRVESGCAETPTPCTCRCAECRGHEPGSDEEVRAIFVRLITFVAEATANMNAKNDALQCIEVLQARLLP